MDKLKTETINEAVTEFLVATENAMAVMFEKLGVPEMRPSRRNINCTIFDCLAGQFMRLSQERRLNGMRIHPLLSFSDEYMEDAARVVTAFRVS